MRIVPISKSGQISIPASVRKRWGSKELELDDLGNLIIIRPVPIDRVKAVRGIFKDLITSSSAELRESARKDDEIAESRR